MSEAMTGTARRSTVASVAMNAKVAPRRADPVTGRTHGRQRRAKSAHSRLRPHALVAKSDRTEGRGFRAHAASFVGSITLTFEGFGEGTAITDQYEAEGIIFSGANADEPPMIAWDDAASTNPVLSGDPLFHGPIHATFVVPGSAVPATVDGLAIDVGFINDPGSTTVSIFTTTGTETLIANEEGFDHLESSASNITGFSVEETSFEAEGFEIDNVTFTPPAASPTPTPTSTPTPTPAPPPPPPPVNPCTPTHGSLAHELLASIKCTAHETELEVECGVAVASLIFLPLKALKLVEAARSIDVLKALPAKARPAAKFLYDLYHATFSRHAPAGFRNGAEAVSTIGKVKHAWELIKILPDLAKAVSHADFSQIALDLDDIAGLKPCVQGVADGLAG
jgi:hypothetical protein